MHSDVLPLFLEAHGIRELLGTFISATWYILCFFLDLHEANADLWD